MTRRCRQCGQREDCYAHGWEVGAQHMARVYDQHLLELAIRFAVPYETLRHDAEQKMRTEGVIPAHGQT